ISGQALAPSKPSRARPFGRLVSDEEWARLGKAAARVLGDTRLLWLIAGIVAVRRLLAEVPVFLPAGADAFGFIESGREALTNPGEIYVRSAALIAAGHPWTIEWPPPQILLAVPFALLPGDLGVYVWAAVNALLGFAGLYCLARAIGIRSVARPIFVLVILCFTPLWEDIRLGQRGGPLLLLAGAAMLTIESNPILAGALTSVGTGIKFYPAAMVLGVGDKQRRNFVLTLIVGTVTVLGLSFIPFGSPVKYLTGILLPVTIASPATMQDCFQNSTPQLFSRLVGGSQWSVIDSSGHWSTVTFLPWHLTTVAHVLTYLTIAGLVIGAVWAARRSGFAQPFSMALAFSLGALATDHVFTYQYVALLPLTLVIVLNSVKEHRWLTLGVVALAIWTFLSSPCALVFPSLWTVAGLGLFAIGVVEAPQFKRAGRPAESSQ
ncbi:MAG TPA: glycosyltransferase family 87 protein, partial [Candidatus Dormibacteraeota bacterium]|nr:glycosyltransferase family 87 protein [Candidatus Dormibacteraeota bacterium]